MSRPINIVDPVAEEVLDLYQAAFDAKEALGLHKSWRVYEDYWRNKQNEPVREDDPGSVTNIIFPIIESQISDIVDEPLGLSVVGEEPSDERFANDVLHLMEWLLFRNKMFYKLDRFERRRLKFGTSVWKTYYEPMAAGGRGLVVFDPISPVNFFPDPRVKDPLYMDEGEFHIHAVEKPLHYIKNHPVYKSAASQLEPHRQGTYNTLSIFEGEDNDTIRETASEKVLVLECWKLEGKKLHRIVVGNETVLYDSRKDSRVGGRDKGFYNSGHYPFVAVPCYPVEGRMWGMGDVELLKPTQDLVNDLDDQIRMNARLMGNIQTVVGMASGINPKKWTNKPGLRIPARDPDAWKMVIPPNIPQYILARRNEGKGEGEMIAGRPDVVEGRRSGGLRAASAILSLQEAGMRRAKHKKLFLENSLSHMCELALDLVKEFFTSEEAYRILGRDKEDGSYLWFKGSSLRDVPRLMPRGDELVPMLNEEGEERTKEAFYDIRCSIGAGLPNNKAFLYQSLLDFKREQLLSPEEARYYLTNILDWPVINPKEPVPQEPMGEDLPPGQGGPSGRMAPAGHAVQTPQEVPPELMQQLAIMMGGGNR